MVTGTSALSRAAALLDEAVRVSSTGLHRRIPFLSELQFSVPKLRGQVQRAVTHAEAAVRELEGGDGRARSAIAGVRELASELQGEVNKAATPPYYGHELRTAPGMLEVARERIRLMESVSSLDDVAARTEIGRRLDDAATGFLSTRTRDDAIVIAAMHTLPDEVRPAGTASRFGSSVWEVWAGVSHKHFSMVGADIDEALPIGVEFRRLSANYAGAPAGTAERELDRLLDLPAADLTNDDVRHIGVLASLPPDLRPAILDTSQPDREFSVALVAMSSDRYGGAAAASSNVDAIRAAREAARLVEAGDVGTKASNTAEVLSILESPTESISATQRRRISVLARLPEDVRPDLPPTVLGEYGLEQVGLLPGPRLTDRAIARTIDRGRAYLQTRHDPRAIAESLRGAQGPVDGLDGVRLAALTTLDRPLEEYGITRSVLSQLFARHLSGAGATAESKGTKLVDSLQQVRDDIATRTLPTPMEPLRTDILRLADRNLDRMRRIRLDTYGSHPDYAEIGRISSMLEFVNRAETVTTSAGPGTAAVADAGSAAERLTW